MLTFTAIVEWSHEIHGYDSFERKQKAERDAFYSVLWVAVGIAGRQLPALLIANTGFAWYRTDMEVRAWQALVSGVALFGLDLLSLKVGVYPYQNIGPVVFFVILPGFASVILFQVWLMSFVPAVVPATENGISYRRLSRGHRE